MPQADRCKNKMKLPSSMFCVSIVVEPDDDRFHAYVPGLVGLHVDGKTEEEAVKNACEAIIVYLDSLAQEVKGG
jgi:predicted RNase H-like HicB family nuclease